MAYNMTNVTNANNLYEMTLHLNTLADGMIGIFLLASIFLLCFMIFKRYEEDTRKIMLASATINIIIGVLLWTVGLIAWHIMIYPILIFFAAAILLKISQN